LQRLACLFILALLTGCPETNTGVSSSNDPFTAPGIVDGAEGGGVSGGATSVGLASSAVVTVVNPEEGIQPPPEPDLYQGGGG
jgi:hypothetical protein